MKTFTRFFLYFLMVLCGDDVMESGYKNREDN